MGSEATGPEDWEQMIAVNQSGTFLGIRAVATGMQKRHSGSIINLSTIAGLAGIP